MNSTRKEYKGKDVAELKKRRYENYLKLKKNLKMTKRSKSDPRKKKADESNILSYTVSGTLYGTVSSILQCKQLKYGVLQSK
jgi:hypothetical protein